VFRRVDNGAELPVLASNWIDAEGWRSGPPEAPLATRFWRATSGLPHPPGGGIVQPNGPYAAAS